MWPDLYRCVASRIWFACAIAIGAIAAGQESVPTPLAEQDHTARSDATLERLHQPLLRQDLKISSATSCAAASCHAGPRPGVLDKSSALGVEYQLWLEEDPHANSWRTICGDESIAIMRRLGILQGDAIVDPQGFDNCLACHNTTRRFEEPRWTTGDATAADLFLREGVGCSACHGPSEQWIATHYQRDWNARDKSSVGFVEADDLYVRARMCVSCHIGDQDRDMNHDIIAAGHPTLRFELATFHAQQPKHWRDPEAGDKTRYEAQLWLAGQVAATDASLSLLKARAERSHSISTWPEFAAYNCASCHHRLALDNDRRSLTGDRQASAIFSEWNDAGLRWLVEYRIETEGTNEQDAHLITALDRVKARMEARPRPNAASVAEAAQHAREVLAEWFDSDAGQSERSALRSDRLGRVVAFAAGRPDTFQHWESAVQFYLAAVATRESWPGGWNGELKNAADQLRSGLCYPQMIDISRYAHRSSSGPQLNRLQAHRLGIELAGWLGPVELETMPAATPFETDGRTIQDELDTMLQAINERWQTEPAPVRDQPPATPAPRPRAQQPSEPKPPGRSIENLRKSLEQLQLRDGQADE